MTTWIGHSSGDVDGDFFSDDFLIGWPIIAPNPGVVEKLRMMVMGGYTFRLGIYEGISSVPQARLGLTADTVAPAGGGTLDWVEVDLISPVELIGGRMYFLAAHRAPGGSLRQVRRLTGGTQRFRTLSFASGTPDPFGASSATTDTFNIQAGVEDYVASPNEISFDSSTGQFFTSNTNWVFSKPGHVHDGDLMIVAVVCDGSGVLTSVPSGWTQIGSTVSGAGDSELRVYYKVANSEPSSWTWVWNANEIGQIELTTYTGQHPEVPIGVTINEDYLSGTIASGTDIDAGPITPPENNCMIVAVMGTDPGGSPSMTSVAPAIPRVDRINGATSWVGVTEYLQENAAPITLEAIMTAPDPYNWNIFAIRPAEPESSVFVPKVIRY